MPKLVLVRHGQSVWNAQNRFTGWRDVPLSEVGVAEAKAAGERLRGHKFDLAFTSTLKRAYTTYAHLIDSLGQRQPEEGSYQYDVSEIPFIAHPDLRERDYGELAGLNKAETAEKYGKEQVHIWRRSYDTPPPGGESLKDTAARVLPYYSRAIEPELEAGNNILIVAHGNSLRALIMHIEGLDETEIPNVEIPTGVPKVYDLADDLKVLQTDFLSEEA